MKYINNFFGVPELIFLSISIKMNVSFFLCPVCVPIPVSYTHLDVYKRQHLLSVCIQILVTEYELKNCFYSCSYKNKNFGIITTVVIIS